jgi:hypothetical protein
MIRHSSHLNRLSRWPNLPRLIWSACLLLGAALVFADAARAEQALVIPRTAQTGNNATNSFEQRGGMVVLDIGDDSSFSIGFWVKRYFGDTQFAGSSSTTDGVVFYPQSFSNGESGTVLKTEHLPEDEDWHYVRADYASGNYYRVWVDNEQKISSSFAGCSFGNCFMLVNFGAVGVFGKTATLTSLLVDDIMIWKTPNTTSATYHTNIWKYGMSSFNAASAELSAYYSFDSTSEAPASSYYVDNTAMTATQTNMASQSYSMKSTNMTLTATTSKPNAYVKVTIDSDYGLSKVTPTADSTGLAEVKTGELTTFTAPLYVYLDRYGNELAGTAEDIRDRAYYRMVNDGYSAAGETFQGTPTTSFTLTVSNPMTVSWFWKKQYAVIIDSSTANIEGISDEDFSGLGNPSLAIQKHWMSEDTLFTTAIDGIINQSNAPVRFSSIGYFFENQPDSSDRYMVFNGTNDFVLLNNVIPLTNLTDFTIEFWAKRDAKTTSSDQDVFALGEGTGSPTLLRVGYRSGANDNAMFIADTNGTVIASVDGAFTDAEWHHWAWTYDSEASLLTLYRDGTAIGSFTKTVYYREASRGIAYDYHKGSAVYPLLAYSNAIVANTSTSTVYEAESSVVNLVDTNITVSGASGNVGEYAETGTAYVRWTNVNHGAVTRLVSFRFYCVGDSNRTATVYLNGAAITNFTILPDSTWQTRTVQVTFTNGNNTIQVNANTRKSLTGPWTYIYLDQMSVWSERTISSLDDAFAEWPRASSGTLSSFTFSPTNQAERFAFKYTSDLFVANPGTYTFLTRSDDGSQLHVDGTRIVNNDGIHGATNQTGSTNLTRGFHELQVRYYEFTGSESLTVSNSGPDTGFSTVALTTNVLYNPAGGYDSAAIGGAITTNRCFAGGINNVRLWNTVRTQADIESSMVTAEYGASAAGLVLEMTFDNAVGTNLTSSQGYTARLVNFGSLFPSGTSTNTMQSVLFPSFTWNQRTNILGRIQTGEVTIQDWIRLVWTWERQYRVSVSTPQLAFQGMPFVIADSGVYEGTSANEVWVPEYSSVTIGTRYRSDDRCYTLNSIEGQSGQLRAMDLQTVVDGTFNGAAARQYSISYVTNYGDIMFTYDRTIFRAEVLLGSGLNVSNTTVLNTQLVPNICDGAELQLTGAGPTNVIMTIEMPENPKGAVSANHKIVFDAVGKQLLPVMPGRYRVDWRDANNPNLSYLIEVVTHLPGETLNLRYDREDEDGYRQGVHPDYVTELTFGTIPDAFPASPDAHYRHFYTVGDATPPVDLDPNEADRWYFNEVTYSTMPVTIESATDEMKSESSGRAVLLYNYTAAATSVARGDKSREAYAVRIVEAIHPDSRKQTAGSFSTNFHYAVEFTNNAALSPSPNGTDFFLFGDGSPVRTMDFWYQASSSPASPNEDQIIFYENGLDIDTLSQSYRTSFGVRSATNSTNPNGFFFTAEHRDGNVTTNYTTIGLTELTDVPQDYGWHHWALIRNGNNLQIYRNGLLIAEQNYSAAVGAYVNGIGPYLGGASSSGISSGRLDNFRVWSSVLTAEQVRASMRVAAATFATNNLLMDVNFDRGIQSRTRLLGTNQVLLEFFTNRVASTYLYSPGGSLSNRVVTPTEDGKVEVATRLRSKFDTSGLESGYILPEVSNYNPYIYDRDADAGAWGPIYPINWSGLFTNEVNQLEVAWYENPYRTLPASSTTLHPNVDWPHVVVAYDEVTFPEIGEHKDKRIYISSRLGSEGVDVNGTNQLVFDPATYSQLAIYSQPDPYAAGYNPNEEHALIAPSIKDQLTGDTTFNLGQDAAFALQNGLNKTDESNGTAYTSEPWVLVQYANGNTGEMEMAAYKVEATRAGTASFPALDSTTHLPTDELGQPVAQPTNPTYDFDYTTFAGDVLIPPYPVNLVIGNVTVSKNWGGNIGLQSTLWKDISGNHWTISGNGMFFFRYWYPFRDDFWYDLNKDSNNDLTIGTAFAWMPADGLYTGTTSTNAQVVRYSSYWRDDYPTLKRGETLTYAGGEYKAENASSQGLPAIVAFASAQVVFDSAWSPMVFNLNTLTSGVKFMDKYSARIIRPLDRIEASVAQSAMPIPLTPAYTDNIMVDGPRWYFKGLTGSLQKRFYYDTLTSKLVFRGRLNDLESGDPDLTATPVSTYILEPNIMTKKEYDSIVALASSESTWKNAVQSIFLVSQDPNDTGASVDDTQQQFYAGMEPLTAAYVTQPGFYEYTSGNQAVTNNSANVATFYGMIGYTNTHQHLNSLGAGSAVIPNSTMLTNDSTQDFYITVAENNHPDAGGAISLHIIRIGEERYRGSIKLVEAQNVFDEKVNLRHSGDFGGNTEDIYYQWWVRDVGSLNSVGLPGEDLGWQIYTQGLGLNKIEFAGRPDVMLADKMFYVRYGQAGELSNVSGVVNVVTNDASLASVHDDSWRLVDFSDDSWKRGNGNPVPHQWAGAANSPQLQADGSKKYIPQLIMGWVKRVLDRVNPYEARFSDFYNNNSPATYSSMLQIAGKPFNGKVALNADKDVIENVGLIELYETILTRAKELTLNIVGGSTSGTDQALLLAATRLAFLYELFAREAYSDAQNPLIRVTMTNGLATVAPYVHAFYNQQATLLDEELGLLRGTDFLKAYPAYNRLFWNYVKGEGEAAYNANYNIYDVTSDGFINEFDGATLYPQGHGDAWGHFLSAHSMHYELLRHLAFDWESRTELYSLLDNVIKADYLDEKSFARTAVAKARTGLETLKATYRKAYTEDPDGQWQGYTDADAARAWGVSEWAKRTGQGALFDWIVGNALVPALSTNGVLEDLDRIDRVANKTELSEIAGTVVSIQRALDEANSGLNPVGLDRDAITFDLDPLQYDGTGGTRQTHFEQAYQKAMVAAQNALTALDLASDAENQLQKIANDTDALQNEALRQDIDYRNRLIEIFGTPYDGTIGTGKVFDEGYTGPDTLLYLYVDRTDTTGLIADPASRWVTMTNSTFRTTLPNNYSRADWNPNYVSNTDRVRTLFNRYYLSSDFVDLAIGSTTNTGDEELTIDVPVLETADYAFQAESDWGSRGSYGKIQTILGEMLHEQIALQQAVRDYAAYTESMQIHVTRLDQELRAHRLKERSRSESTEIISGLYGGLIASAVIEGYLQWQWDFAWQASSISTEYFPKVVGLASDATSAARGGLFSAGLVMKTPLMVGWTTAMASKFALQIAAMVEEAKARADEVIIEEFRQMNAIVSEIGVLVTQEESKRLEISKHIQQMHMLAEKLQSAKAEGFRLLDEREAFNMILASKAQGNRYRDMVLRLARNEALTQYQDAFANAQRYSWLAAKAYDYETSLDDGDPAAATTILEEIIKCRTLGLWQSGQPRIGQGGLAHHLARMKSNFDTLKGQLGINNPQIETERLSLRHEHFRVARGSTSSNERWQKTLQAARVDDLWQIPEYVEYCRPFASSGMAQPGLVIEFSTEINSGKNVFGRLLGGADHSYSSANFATKVRSAGVWFENYNATGLSTSPRVYLVPVGADTLRVANADSPTTRTWNVVEQRVPVPFVINTSDLDNVEFIPSLHSLDGSFAEIRRFGDFRAYHTSGETAFDTTQLTRSSRLIGRSMWNTRWLLIIPGATLHSDKSYGLDQFVKQVSDIKLVFETYTHEGN